jgi:hypothetical protein
MLMAATAPARFENRVAYGNLVIMSPQVFETKAPFVCNNNLCAATRQSIMIVSATLPSKYTACIQSILNVRNCDVVVVKP